MRKTRAAIVTTLRDADRVLDSFIRYHLLIGFEQIFLFFDDPHDPSLDKARGYEKVTAMRDNRALRRRWKQTRLYAEDGQLRRFRNKEVMARQELNVAIAVELAIDHRIDWLLHIDIDELFYSPAQTVKEHFGSLSAKGVQQVTYANYEALPDRLDIKD